jgi:hypothetical protein
MTDEQFAFEIAQRINEMERFNFRGRNLPPRAIHNIVNDVLRLRTVGDSAAPSQPAKDKMLALVKRVAGLGGTLAVTTEARQLLKELSVSVAGKP